ncbi:MAG: response regulator [Vicinamibacterales bacterium]
MPHTDPVRGVTLSPQAFAAAFPFHVVIDPDMHVRQVGATLSRLLPDVVAGVPVREHFRLVRPSVPFDFAHLSDCSRDVVWLESISIPLRLKGQMLRSAEQDCVVFLCSPAVTDVRSISSLGLAFEDFAIHDSTVDLMRELQSAQATLADLQRTTDLLRAERAALDDSSSRSRAMLDTSQDAVIALDAAGRVLEFNGAAERIFGCLRTQAVGEDFAGRFIPEGCRGTFRQQVLGLSTGNGDTPCGGLQAGDGPRTELTACTWDGREFPAELSMTRVERSLGAIYVGFIRDITDRHVAMAELLKARDDAEMANRAKSEFLARMSHEIRTPLHAILGMTELALASQLTREQRDFLESVRASSDALLYLINDLLDFSKIEAGQMDIERTDFDLWQIVEGVSDAAAVKASAKGLGVVCWIDPDVPHQVVGDPNRLRQVLMNLAGNAVKFTEQGQVVVRVSAAPEGPQRSLLRLSVADTGPGISEADRPRIFERFFQAQRSNTNRVAGTGLGLSITRTLVELMGGSIGFDSIVGTGTTFTVLLPLDLGERPSRQRGWHDLPSEPVLVVDPEEVERDMVRSHLEHHGCTVGLVRTAAEALAELARRPYAAAIINHVLPDQTGLELIRTIRSERPADPMRIVLIGAVPSPQLVGTVVSDCVVKPVHASRLLDALDTRVAADRARAVVTTPALPPAYGTERPLRILVAEDNAENQRVATRILEGAGAQVDIAQDGRTAVDMAVRTRYDLVLMDLQMPVLDGSQAAVAIRDAERLTDDEPVPIVAFTAHAVEGFREQCLQAGMNDYIVKPITTQDLIDAVHRWADRRPAVLVADDSPEIRQLVKHRLRDTYRVVQAVNGREALEQFGRQHISVILLDMNMPVMDGYATAAAIRLREDGRHVPIVAVTGNEETESRERATAAGCTMHLMKPVRLATLFSTVEAAMRQTADALVPQGEGLPSGVAAEAPVHLDIDPLLADLVPGYVREKRRQIGDLRRLIAEHDMDRVKRIAHDIKGTGSAYGIPDVTRLGRALETAGQQRDEGGAAGLVEELDALLARVQQQLGG